MKRPKKNYDIIFLDKKIQSMLDNDERNIDKYKKKLISLTKKLQKVSRYHQKKILEEDIYKMEIKIQEIESGVRYGLYISRTHHIIKRYNDVLQTKIPINFIGTNDKDSTSDLQNSQDKLIKEYINIARDYIKIEPIYAAVTKINNDICSFCNSNDIEEVDHVCICTNCGKESKMVSIKSSFMDSDRVNITTKYKYDRISHFKGIINKYQAKQTTSIPEELFTIIKTQLELHGLTMKKLSSDKKVPKGTKKLKYKKVTKKHIYMFLKETGYNGYYDDYKIYKNIKTSDNKKKRKNFLNSQYVLFQLLKKYKYKCKKEDFNILKTRDRLLEHDEIYSNICQELKWSCVHTV